MNRQKSTTSVSTTLSLNVATHRIIDVEPKSSETPPSRSCTLRQSMLELLDSNQHYTTVKQAGKLSSKATRTNSCWEDLGRTPHAEEESPRLMMSSGAGSRFGAFPCYFTNDHFKCEM
ncbi:hypothetical protein HI914_04775 [Erysiphe necator]|nr:hypothetical protein HI914_04775 [Erysiphe necator]